MQGMIGGGSMLVMVFYLVVMVMWFMVPIFVFLISRRVKHMRDMARKSRMEVKELNASLKYLKRKYKEANDLPEQESNASSEGA